MLSMSCLCSPCNPISISPARSNAELKLWSFSPFSNSGATDLTAQINTRRAWLELRHLCWKCFLAQCSAADFRISWSGNSLAGQGEFCRSWFAQYRKVTLTTVCSPKKDRPIGQAFVVQAGLSSLGLLCNGKVETMSRPHGNFTAWTSYQRRDWGCTCRHDPAGRAKDGRGQQSWTR
jgi:hypothetical protein